MKTRSQDAKPSDKSRAVVSNNKKKKAAKPKKRAPTADDPKKPKKPPTAFFYYLEDFRKTYQAEHPHVKSMRDIGKACGQKWKIMNFEGLLPDLYLARLRNGHHISALDKLRNHGEKVQYYDVATEKRAEYEKAMAAYIKRKESGELSEESDDEYE